MDRIDTYRHNVQQVIINYKDQGSYRADITSQAIFDTEQDHYQLVIVGWENDRRVYGCLFHFDIVNNKIWLQYNGTEADVAQELVEMGVPKEDIVIGFHSPFVRQFTEYALG